MGTIKVAILEKDGTEYQFPVEMDLNAALAYVGAPTPEPKNILAVSKTAASDTIFTSVPELSMTLQAGMTYLVTYRIMHTSANKDSGIEFSLQGTATAEIVALKGEAFIGNNSVRALNITSLSFAYNFPTIPNNAETLELTVSGFIKCLASGTISFNFRSESGNRLITVFPGSYSYREALI
jgi:hypothetical protein